MQRLVLHELDHICVHVFLDAVDGLDVPLSLRPQLLGGRLGREKLDGRVAHDLVLPTDGHVLLVRAIDSGDADHTAPS